MTAGLPRSLLRSERQQVPSSRHMDHVSPGQWRSIDRVSSGEVMTATANFASEPTAEAGDAAPAASAGPFVLNLCSSTTPMALAQTELAELKRFTFFVSRRFEEGRERFRLHMGYFPTLAEAEEWLGVVRDIYPGAWAGEAPGRKLRERAAAAAAAQATHAAGPQPVAFAATVRATAPVPSAPPPVAARPIPELQPAPQQVPVLQAAPPVAPRVPAATAVRATAAPPATAAPARPASALARPVARASAPAPPAPPVVRAAPPAAVAAPVARAAPAASAAAVSAARVAAPAAAPPQMPKPRVPAAPPARVAAKPPATAANAARPPAQAALPAAPKPATPAPAVAAARPAAGVKPAVAAKPAAPAKPVFQDSNVREVLKALGDASATGETRLMRAPPPPREVAAPAANNSLSDTQVLKMLETRRSESSEAPAAEIDDSGIPLLKPDDTGTRQALKDAVASNAAVSFAVQLQWSVWPVELDKMPPLAIFSAYTLYTVEGSRDGRKWYGVRLGFFSDALSAKQVAYYVRSEFASVAVVPVSPEEKVRATEQEIAATLATPVPTRSDPIEEFKLIDDAPAIPKAAAAPLAAAAAPAGGAKLPPGKPVPKVAVGRTVQQSQQLAPAPPPPPPEQQSAKRARAKVGARERKGQPTLEETLEILGAGELQIDGGTGETLNDSGVRHLRVEVQKNSPFSKLLERLSERMKKS
jgi:hypothetical protein